MRNIFCFGKLFLFVSLLCFVFSIPASAAAVDNQCRAKGIRLYGKVKQVKYHPDLKVKRVKYHPDLKVQQVKYFPDKCGKWQWVDSFPDFTVQFVDSFPDITIKYVDSFPGRP